jgi:hypothetical protein
MGSRGDAVSKVEGGDPSGLVAGVAVGDVVGERAAGGMPVGVIGVVEHASWMGRSGSRSVSARFAHRRAAHSQHPPAADTRRPGFIPLYAPLTQFARDCTDAP